MIQKRMLSLAAALGVALLGPAYAKAQDAEAPAGSVQAAPAQGAAEDSAAAEEVTEDTSAPAGDGIEEVVVTGSRLKRDTYSSVSPLQVIDTKLTREVGLFEAGSILQASTASSGQQIDLTFSGFVLDNGPGASTVDLRGLGAERTLVLVNGRRLAPGGVEGAPSSPNLNLIPRSLVKQYDLLLDGASSVYGSDAMAGVVNAILRKDFDGIEIEGYSQIPDQDGGGDNTLSVTWGKNFDKGVIGIGVEYAKNQRVTLGDRRWTDGCEKNAEVDKRGSVRSRDLYYESLGYPSLGDCTLGSLAGRVSGPSPHGSVYYTPGTSNGGWGNFSESGDPYTGLAADGNGDGIGDVDLRQYSLNGSPGALEADLFPKQELQNWMAYGEYNFDGEANLTPYFEANYSKQDFESNSGEGQLFPYVPALNPFNLCNPLQPNGVDCGLAGDAYLDNPSIAANFANEYGLTPAELRDAGIVDLYSGAIGPQQTRPIVSVRGDRNLTEVENEQSRFVAGFRGDLPFMNFASVREWSFDTYISYSKSKGQSKRFGVREDRLDYALGAYSELGDSPCQDDTGSLGADATTGCVPVNLFAPSLYPVGQVTGDFATQAERDYLFDTRDFETEYEQTIFSAYATGTVFELPAGSVGVGLGLESRKDEISSRPDDVARDGLLWGFFSDGGAEGDKRVDEFFGEIEIPLLANVPGATELTLNASARITDDEYYGTNNTKSFKLGWRPVDSLLVRATYGTAFRAPNLRELFLRSQTGFLNLFDPCYIPEGALNELTGAYDPSKDDRDPLVLQNCLANGTDPTLANSGGFNVFSTEVSAGGSLELDPEESESWTLGFSWEQPFTDAFALTLGTTYYEIEISNTVIEPGAQFIINDCYNSNTGDSAFCSRISRDLSDPSDPFLVLIDQGFINRDQERVRGIDYNLKLGKNVTILGAPVDLSLDVVMNNTREHSTLFVDDNGNADSERTEGEWGWATWKGNAYFRAEWDRFRATWEVRYIHEVATDDLERNPFSDINGSTRTCLGPPSDVQCRDVGETGDYFMHSFSVYYEQDTWTAGMGVRNLFEQKPPFVSGNEVLSNNNAPIGYGYDLNGRTFFFNLQARFGGSK